MERTRCPTRGDVSPPSLPNRCPCIYFIFLNLYTPLWPPCVFAAAAFSINITIFAAFRSSSMVLSRTNSMLPDKVLAASVHHRRRCGEWMAEIDSNNHVLTSLTAIRVFGASSIHDKEQVASPLFPLVALHHSRHSCHSFPQSRFNEMSRTQGAAASSSHPLHPAAPRQPLDNDDLDDILANADPALLMCVPPSRPPFLHR